MRGSSPCATIKDGFPRGVPAVETVPVDDSGHFHFDDLDPGMYNVRLWFDVPDGRTETIEKDIEVVVNSVITEDFVTP